MIYNYKKYILLEELDNRGSIRLIISPKIFKILKKIITDPVANAILKYKDYSDISFLDIGEDSKTVSYLPVDRLNRLNIDIDELNLKTYLSLTKGVYDINQDFNIDSVWKSNLRQNIGWGKLINKLFPGVFTNVDIDRFYDRYRPEVDHTDKDSRFKIVYGEDIRKWYHHNNFDGEIGSCMRYSKCQPFFDIYCNNPEKCGMLIYFSEKDNNKIIGRALLWNNLIKPSGDTVEDKCPYTLLDRVYYVNSSGSQIEAAFHAYAIEKNWIYKKNSQFLMNGQFKTNSVTTRLKPVDYKYYPYVDTMYYYTPETGRASSAQGNPPRDPNNPGKIFNRYELRSQEGGRTKLN